MASGTSRRWGPWLLLLAATGFALTRVPAFPRLYADDPNSWGVWAGLVGALLLAGRGLRGAEPRRFKTVLAGFLFGMPLVYLADWLRFGGSVPWLGIELVGAGVYWALLVWGLRRGIRALAVGVGLHALWDLIHYGTSSYVPDWYVVACVIIDGAVAAAVLWAVAPQRDAASA